MSEEWRDIPGYSTYQASTHGRVRKVRRGRSGRLVTRSMKQSVRSNGYRCVGLTSDEGKRKSITVHRIVAMTFLDNKDGAPCVLHGDGVKTNNHVSNLRWGTYADNVQDMKKHGTFVYNHDAAMRTYRSASV